MMDWLRFRLRKKLHSRLARRASALMRSRAVVALP